MSNHETHAEDEDDVSDALVDELMSVMSIAPPELRAAVAALDGLTLADWDQAIANWKTRRVQ